jgi:hypothetical protein
MTQHTSRLCKGNLTKESDGAASDDLASIITWPQPKSEGKAANKCSANMGTRRLLEKHSRWSWLSVQGCQGKWWLLRII